MKEISWRLFLTINKLKLLKYLNLHLDIWTTFKNIDNPYFEGVVNRIYPPELQLNKANTADTEAPFLDLHLSISNGFVSSKIYDKRDDFDFDIVNFPFLDGDVPRSTSYGVYISQLIRFARVSVCLVFNPITVNNFASLFNCTPVGRESDSMMAPT